MLASKQLCKFTRQMCLLNSIGIPQGLFCTARVILVSDAFAYIFVLQLEMLSNLLLEMLSNLLQFGMLPSECASDLIKLAPKPVFQFFFLKPFVVVD